MNIKKLSFVVLVLLMSIPAAAAPGDLDPGFNGTGRASFKFGQSLDAARGLAVMPDGRVYVAGLSASDGVYDFALARFRADGTPDPTFGSFGFVTTDFLNGADEGTAVALQPDGKIVVVGSVDSGVGLDFGIARYNSDGTLDTTFDTDGRAVVSINADDELPTAVAVRADGKIVVAGYATVAGFNEFAVVVLNANGSPDTSFDGDGIVTTDIGTQNDRATAVVLRSDGKIIAVGVGNSGTDTLALVRYNSNGSIDTTFAGGIVVVAASMSDASAAIQPDDKIVVAGSTIAARLNDDGTLDAAFGGGGFVSVTFGGQSVVNAVAIEPTGEILFGGTDFDGVRDRFALSRRLDDGTPDPAFGVSGVVTTSIAGAQESITALGFDASGGTIVAAGDTPADASFNFAFLRYQTDGTLAANSSTDLYKGNAFGQAVARQADGKLVIAGYATDAFGASRVALARLNVDGTLDNSFDTDGKLTTQVGAFGSQATAVAIQTDGKIVVAVDSATSNVALVRYNSNGSLDTTFDGDGIVETTFSGLFTPTAMKLQSDGKIVVAASFLGTLSVDFAVVRYNSNGTLDTTFDGDGVAVAAVGANGDRAYALALQNDGKIIVGGVADNGSSTFCCSFGVVRLNTNGSPDSSFDGDGRVTVSMGGFIGQVRSLAVQPDGKIVAAGYADDDFGVVRINPNGSFDSSFGAAGIVVTSVGPFTDRAESVLLQPDGRILVSGWSSSFTSYDFAVVRYNANGSLDNSFAAASAGLWGTGGVAVVDFGDFNDFPAAAVLDPLNRPTIVGWSGKFVVAARLQNVAPTAANVAVSGRVVSGGGGNVRNAVVTLSESDGTVRQTRTNSFGNFRFDGVASGQTITVGVTAKGQTFSPTVVGLEDELSDLVIVANGGKF